MFHSQWFEHMLVHISGKRGLLSHFQYVSNHCTPSIGRLGTVSQAQKAEGFH